MSSIPEPASPASPAIPEGIVEVAADDLRAFAAALFRARGVPEADAERVAECLVDADLRGVASHGVSRLPIYLERLARGRLNPTPRLAVERALTVAARIDGDDGLGFVVATRAMELAIEIAREHGVGLVLAHRSNHFGMAASYLKQAVEAGLVALVFTNASPAMPVWGGREAFLGTSPFAFAAPAGPDRPAIVLDMAMSVVARGKVRRAMHRGEAIPTGWALDRDGRDTTDARAGYEGVVLPMGGMKGSGLSLMMEILAGVLSGSAFGGQVRDQYRDFEAPSDVGHFFLALRPDLFAPAEEYGRRMAGLVARAKATRRAEGVGEILMPGEPEARRAAARAASGIPLDAGDVAPLRALAAECGVAVPAALAADA